MCIIGSSVLVLTATEVDKTGASYYGEQNLYYLSVGGEGNMVTLGGCVRGRGLLLANLLSPCRQEGSCI